MLNEELNHLYMPSNFTGEDGKQVFADFILKEEKLHKDFSAHFNQEIRYGQDESQAVDIYGKVEKKLFLSIHGGYWMEGSRQYGMSPVVPFFEDGWAVGSVGYKLAIDGYGLKATIGDAIRAVEKVLDSFPDLEDVVIAGHSAGGYLCWKGWCTPPVGLAWNCNQNYATVPRRRRGENEDIQTIPLFLRSKPSQNLVAAAVKSVKIKAVIALAPIFKIRELTETEVGLAIRLREDDYKELDCRFEEWHDLKIAALFMVGTNESPPFKEQLMTMVKELRSHNEHVRTEQEIFDGSNHFSLVWNMGIQDSSENKKVRDFIGSL